MSDNLRLLTFIGVCWVVFSGVILWLGNQVGHESRKWRHLVQLYYEARLRKSLATEAGQREDGPVSSLSLPKDIQAELARQDAEREMDTY